MTDTKQVLSEARAGGWTVTRTRSGHWRLVAPTGALVFTGSTPGDRRATRNLRAQLRRASVADLDAAQRRMTRRLQGSAVRSFRDGSGA